MIDLRDLREHPERYIEGARDKNIPIDITRILSLDERIRGLMSEQEAARAEQKKISKEVGPQIGKLKSQLAKAEPGDRAALERELVALEAKPLALKDRVTSLDAQLAQLRPELDRLLLEVPQPPDSDVPRGASAEDNIEISRWNPAGFDPEKTFRENRGFDPRSHIDLMRMHDMVDFERAVRMSGARHYVLTGDGMRLQQAVLRYAFDFITNNHGFTPVYVPVIVREQCMEGTGFFPHGREQAYQIEETSRGAGHDLFLTGTGEVGLMGLHQDEILDANQLPLQYATVSTCFRREAGAAGKDTAGLYRIHQFEKVEQVVICRNDQAESRSWHRTMIDIVERLLQSLALPYRLLQCCTGDLGPKNADMIDIETWMPSRGEVDDAGAPRGAYGETHSASRLYDFQCRRLKLRYREADSGKPVFCHSLNNTVAATPRLLIPIIEMHQNDDGSIALPQALRPYMNGRDRIG